MSQHRLLLFALTVVIAVALGTWTRRAAIDAGYWADDYAQLAMLEGTYPSARPSWDLFHFLDGTAEDHQRILDAGAYPWWTHPQMRLSMLRPLPSLVTVLDHQLFRFEAEPKHWHSMLWWLLLLLAVGAVLFEALPPLTAAVALLLFSLDESHTVPVLWLANRSALMATTLMIASLAAYVRWSRVPERTSWRSASVALCALAFACGEYAFASLGYLISVAWLDKRTRTLAPHLGIALVFLLVSTLLGYGSAHSALYTSPFSAPLDYMLKLVVGFPVLMAELVLGVPADWWSFGSPWPQQLRAALSIGPDVWDQLPSWKACQLLLGGVSIAITVGVLRWLQRRVTPQHHRVLTWLVGGACLGVLPSMGSFITTRLAMPASFAFAALFASVLTVARADLSRAGRIGSALAALLLVYVHGYRAFEQSQAGTNFYAFVARSRTAWAMTAKPEQGAASLVMINSADANDAAYTSFVRSAVGQPALPELRILSAAPGSHAVTRVDDRTLEVRVTDDFGLATSFADSFTRSASDTFSNGDTVSVAGMDVTVLQTHLGQPTYMRFRFDAPLDSDRFAFVHSTARGLTPLLLPPGGSTRPLAPPLMPNLALLAGP